MATTRATKMTTTSTARWRHPRQWRRIRWRPPNDKKKTTTNQKHAGLTGEKRDMRRNRQGAWWPDLFFSSLSSQLSMPDFRYSYGFLKLVVVAGLHGEWSIPISHLCLWITNTNLWFVICNHLDVGTQSSIKKMLQAKMFHQQKMLQAKMFPHGLISSTTWCLPGPCACYTL